jgi:hypothetical protein
MFMLFEDYIQPGKHNVYGQFYEHVTRFLSVGTLQKNTHHVTFKLITVQLARNY